MTMMSSSRLPTAESMSASARCRATTTASSCAGSTRASTDRYSSAWSICEFAVRGWKSPIASDTATVATTTGAQAKVTTRGSTKATPVSAAPITTSGCGTVCSDSAVMATTATSASSAVGSGIWPRSGEGMARKASTSGSMAAVPSTSPMYQSSHTRSKAANPSTCSRPAPTVAPARGPTSEPQATTCRKPGACCTSRPARPWRISSQLPIATSAVLGSRNASDTGSASPYARFAARLPAATASSSTGMRRGGALTIRPMASPLANHSVAMLPGCRARWIAA